MKHKGQGVVLKVPQQSTGWLALSPVPLPFTPCPVMGGRWLPWAKAASPEAGLEQRHPQRMSWGQKLFPCPLPSAPVDTGGNPGVSFLQSPCHLHPTNVSQCALQERPHITLASLLHCCYFLFFVFLWKTFPFSKCYPFQSNYCRNLQRLLTWLRCGFFFFASSQSFSQLLEELKLGPFKCKWSNLQNMYFGTEATWLCKQTGVLLILWTAISGSYLVAVIWVLMWGDCFHLS